MASLSPSRADVRETPAPKRAKESAEPDASTGPLISADSSLLQGVAVTLQARLGEASMPIAELLDLRSGSVVGLEAGLNDLVGLYLNDTLVARGEIVAVDDMFGIRIVEIAA